ncbi:Uma2 family endonuclease [Ohtaekwangia kribbensis]|uniref:Uma2 family endonuclease n=1 Tax=Ohtaekwangia kribbensis TaxID=688913 RepID=A0ABW3JYS9_9BACT
MSDDQFFHFCRKNEPYQIERNSLGEIIVMEPTWSETGRCNFDIATELGIWNKQKKSGYAFDSSAGFTLPNSAIRAADAAFIKKERWNQIPTSERQKFTHICPDFVIEIISPSDSPFSVESKMKEWIDNGCQLAWMVNPKKRTTTIYRSNGDVIIKPFKELLDGEDILPGFSINMATIFSPY